MLGDPGMVGDNLKWLFPSSYKNNSLSMMAGILLLLIIGAVLWRHILSFTQ
jgi:hypothetical protein